MAREIRRKVIDSDLGPAGIAEQADENAVGADPPNSSFPSLEGGSGADFIKDTRFDSLFSEDETKEGNSGFSLDAFEVNSFKDLPEISDSGADNSLLESDSEQPAEETPAPAPKKGLFSRKIVAVGLGCLLTLCVAITVLVAWLSPAKAPPNVVTLVRRPVTIPHFQGKLDFFILAQTQEDKAVVSMSLEFEFHDSTRYRYFTDQNVLLKDTIYSFLKNQRPTKNSMKYWQPIILKELPGYLKNALPSVDADLIRLSSLETL